MTTVLHLPARPDAPIACDMTTAQDTPDERIAAYRVLFEEALLRRERKADAVVFTFRAPARATVEDLARREAACCPFLDYRVETVGDEVVWTLSNAISGPERQGGDLTLDAFHALPGHDPMSARTYE
jgi:hypothetical protein